MVRLIALPVLFATGLYVAVFGVVRASDPAFSFLFLVAALTVGFRFGPREGALAAMLPIGALFLFGSGGSVVRQIAPTIAAVMFVGGTAWFAGVLRERFGHAPWETDSHARKNLR